MVWIDFFQIFPDFFGFFWVFLDLFGQIGKNGHFWPQYYRGSLTFLEQILDHRTNHHVNGNGISACARARAEITLPNEWGSVLWSRICSRPNLVRGELRIKNPVFSRIWSFLTKRGRFLDWYLCIGDYPKMGVLAYMSKKGPLFGHLLRGALKHRYFLEYLIGDYVGVFEFRPKPVKSAQKGGPKRSKNPDFGVLGPRSDCYI